MLSPDRTSNPCIVICGGHIGESQANMQVRGDIVSGWVDLLGRESVEEASIAAAASTIKASSPDFVLCVGSYLPTTAYFGEIKAAANAAGARCAFWATEDPYEIDAGHRIARDFDVIFTCDSCAVDYYHRGDVYHLPMAGSRSSHYRSYDTNADRPIDILFCGVAFNNRKRIIRGSIDRLRTLNVLIIGPGWAEFGRGFSDSRIEKDELIRLYTSAKVVLNMGRSLSFENERYKLVPSTPGPRTFEAALAGTTQLFYEDTSEIDEYFSRDEIARFSSIAEFHEVLDRLLGDGDERCRLARNAQTAALASHTYMHRAATMLNTLRTSIHDDCTV